MPGLCSKHSGKWIYQEAEAFDIRRLPWPDRSYYYAHPDHYNYFEIPHCAQVRTAYSCASNCKFCYRNVLNCGSYTARDIEDVVDEIASIDSEGIYIIDDDFLIDAKRIGRFLFSLLYRAQKFSRITRTELLRMILLIGTICIWYVNRKSFLSGNTIFTIMYCSFACFCWRKSRECMIG